MNRKAFDIVRAGLPAFAYFYTVGSIGFWLPLYAKELSWPYTLITLLSTIYFITVTPSTILAGIAADLLRRPSQILALGMTGNAIASVMMAHTENPHIMLFLRGVQGASLSVSLPIALGSLSLLQGVARGVAFTAMFSGLGMATGSAAGGILREYLGFSAIFYSSGIISLASALSVIGWDAPLPSKAPKLVDALRRLNVGIAVFMIALIFRNFFASGVFSIITIVFNRIVGLGFLYSGIALAVNPVTQSIWSLAIHEYVRGKEPLLYSIGIAGGTAVFTIYLSTHSIIGAIAAQVLLGLTYGLIVVAGNSYIITNAPEEIRYTASSLYGFAFNVGWILGTIVSGPYMDAHSPESWIRLASFGLLLTALIPLVTLVLPEHR